MKGDRINGTLPFKVELSLVILFIVSFLVFLVDDYYCFRYLSDLTF